MAFELPPLPYEKAALQPYMSAETLELHHGKHHNTYVETANKLIQGTGLEGKPLDEAVCSAFADKELATLFNNLGQHWNHSHFWRWMKPGGGGAIPGELESRIKQDFGGVDAFKQKFVEAGVGQFGSGWCWLVIDGGKLAVTKTPNGENPLCFGQTALLGCDVWEHSYYLDYRNRRPDYLKAFVDNLVNWDYVTELYEKAR